MPGWPWRLQSGSVVYATRIGWFVFALAMVLTTIDVLPYLRQRGLLDAAEVVDGGVTVTEAARRNSNFRVKRRAGSGYLVKQAVAEGAHHTLFCEASVRSFLQIDARAASLRVSLPSMVHYEPEDALLVFDLVEGARSLWECSEAPPTGSSMAAIGAYVGRVLADLHRSCRAADLSGDEQLAMLPQVAPFILWAHKPGPEILASISPANYQTLRIVQNEGSLSRHLDRLRKDWRVETLVHGDVKSDNLLFVDGPSQRLVLVDWELAHFGDPAWDVGSALHDLLSFWVYSMPVTCELAPEDMIARARHPIADMQRAQRELWSAYRAAAAIEPAHTTGLLLRCVRYCAARLVQSAFESSQGQVALSNYPVMMLQVAANMFADPERAAVHLLGIALAS
jgi:aminoglycoside phosphotransferase (APT) family kinase protein